MLLLLAQTAKITLLIKSGMKGLTGMKTRTNLIMLAGGAVLSN